MPLGGYCTVCQRWVWLTPYGECQNGHPASAVRDVQQLKPQTEPGTLVGEVLEDGRPRARFRWWWRHSAWIAWTFSLGFLNWLAFVYVGVRARHTPWTLFGFAYLVPLLLTIAAVASFKVKPAEAGPKPEEKPAAASTENKAGESETGPKPAEEKEAASGKAR